jgi:RNA polymerase sigma-70 factor (ECF subfamily)
VRVCGEGESRNVKGTEKTQPLVRADDVGSDAALAAGLDARDPAALAAFYDRYAGYALAVALRILRDRPEAEEAVQDAIWQIWSGRVRYDPLRGKFRTWVFTVARSRALDRLRRRAPVGAPIPARDLPSEASGSEDAELQTGLARLLGRLTRDQRDVVVLAFYEGLTHNEIAERLGEPVGTVKSRIRRGLLELRAALEAEGPRS